MKNPIIIITNKAQDFITKTICTYQVSYLDLQYNLPIYHVSPIYT